MFVKRDDFGRYQTSRCTSMMQSRRTIPNCVESLSSTQKASISREGSQSVQRKYPKCVKMTLDDVIPDERVISTISEEVSATAQC